MKHLAFYLFFILLIISCNSDFDFEEGSFPLIPENFTSINSKYDDYNSAAPYDLHDEVYYLFSSNRNSNGENFDIISTVIQFYHSAEEELTNFDNLENTYSIYDSATEEINTGANEYGPLLSHTTDYLYNLIMYASDSSGNLDIYYTYNSIYEEDWQKPALLDKINTEFNEAYPTFNKTRNEFYFCSDEEQQYDIYKINLENHESVIQWFLTEEAPIKAPCKIINSSSDDKCPYINRDLMVFTSNRPGGFGGYDLYYSELKDGNWTKPVNFGEKINTEYDEYRPITLFVEKYTNDVMLFSSNRPGGKGGFDLYYVGIPKMIQ